MGVHDVLGSLDDSLVVGEAQIVVGAEVQHLLAVGDDLDALGRGDDTLVLVGTGGADLADLGLEVSQEFYEGLEQEEGVLWVAGRSCLIIII